MIDVRTERAALCDLFERLGPDAPTLCAGWTTADLAAHLVLRERRIDALPGIALAPFARYTAAVQARIRQRHPWPELIGLVRNGPPAWSPYRVPAIDALVNTLELFVHHEDVRRAQDGWEPRELPAGFQDLLWRRLRGMARLMFRRAPVGVVLRRTGGERIGGKKADPYVVVTGEPQELMLFAFGRQAHARVTCTGDEEAVDRLRTAPLGV
jgi:TIGR03085 family protein